MKFSEIKDAINKNDVTNYPVWSTNTYLSLATKLLIIEGTEDENNNHINGLIDNVLEQNYEGIHMFEQTREWLGQNLERMFRQEFKDSLGVEVTFR